MDPISVVVADDEPSYRKALERTLKLIPECRLIAVCCDGEEAYDICAANKPQVLLTDIGMPKMSGIELIARLGERLPDLKSVILTVREDDESIYDAFRAGALGYLLKTSTPNDVIEAIRAASKGEAKITPKVAARLIKDFREMKPAKGELNPDMMELSTREQEILLLIGEGMRNKEISLRLKISEKTVKNHVSAILKALRVSSRTEAAMKLSRSRA